MIRLWSISTTFFILTYLIINYELTSRKVLIGLREEINLYLDKTFVVVSEWLSLYLTREAFVYTCNNKQP